MNHVTVWDMDKEAPATEALYRRRFMYGGLSVDQAANLASVSKTIYKRWEAGRQRTPVAAFKLIKYLAGGHHALIAELENQQSTVIPFKSSYKYFVIGVSGSPLEGTGVIRATRKEPLSRRKSKGDSCC